ncbi:hypothetical protein [Vibrio spartinae]|nr:hypothetical protein [Vibrio spartinae]
MEKQRQINAVGYLSLFLAIYPLYFTDAESDISHNRWSRGTYRRAIYGQL